MHVARYQAIIFQFHPSRPQAARDFGHSLGASTSKILVVEFFVSQGGHFSTTHLAPHRLEIDHVTQHASSNVTNSASTIQTPSRTLHLFCLEVS
jgi:hypothetical protein